MMSFLIQTTAIRLQNAIGLNRSHRKKHPFDDRDHSQNVYSLYPDEHIAKAVDPA